MTDELQKASINIPLFAGQQSAADSRVMEPGSLTLVENGRFQTNGQLQKRPGLTSFTNLTSTGSQITQGRQVLSAGNSLFCHDGNNLYVWNAVNSNWVLLGGINAGAIQSTVLAQSRTNVTEISSAASNSAVCVAWTESGAIKYSVYVPSNGSFLQSAVQLTAAGAKPNVVTLGSDFFIAWIDTATNVVNLLRIPANALTTSGASVGVTTALTVNGYYDICAGGSYVTVVSRETSGTPLVVARQYDSTLALQATTSVTSATWGADSRIWCFACSNSDVMYGNASAWASITYGGPTAFPGTGAFSAVRRMTGTGASTSASVWAEVAPVPSSGTTQIYLAACTLNAQTATLTDLSISYFTNTNSYLGSRAFTADGFAYVWVLSDFQLQSQLTLLDASGRIVGRALTDGNAASNDGIFSALPSVAVSTDSDGATNYYFAARRRAQVKFDAGGNVFTTVGAALINLRYDHPKLKAVAIGGSVYFSGAAPKLYDGRSLSELGFYWYSDTPALTVVAGAGNLSAGSYTYAACFAWYDNQGKLWRSPIVLVPPGSSQPNGSSGATVTVTAGAGVTISNLSYLQGGSKGTNAFLELYRTTANGSTLYKITELQNVNTLGFTSTTYSDSLADTALTGEICYTDGSTPPYMSPPGFAYLAATANRVYGLATETNEVWVSDLTSQTVPAQFVLGQTLSVPLQSPTCHAIMDGQLYIFSENSICTTNADGASLSVSSTVQFAPPRVLPVAKGCTAPGSLLQTDDGIWYQSALGMMLLDRQQGINFVGEPVKNYTDTILAALSLPGNQTLRFVAGAQVLVYDTVYKRWGVDTGQTPIDACAWQDTYVMLTSGGIVKHETAGTYTDDGTFYSLKVVTPWIKPAGINGYARCWRFAILGEAEAAHTLQVRIAYQYDSAWVNTLTIASTAANPAALYGSGLGTYGRTYAGVYGGGAPNAYQFEAVMPSQKATSFRFEISDTGNSGTGQGPVLNMLTLLCGVIPGLARLPASKGMV